MAVAAWVANAPRASRTQCKAIQGYFASLNRETAEINYKQAMMPVGAHVILIIMELLQAPLYPSKDHIALNILFYCQVHL